MTPAVMPPAGRPPAVHYPDSDGQPIAENTVQYRWIVTLQGNLDLLFRDRDDVFVAGDHLIYPVEGDNKLCQAPDVYVAFGRPKRDRGSYQVWEERGIFPQVVFEVLSPGNRPAEMARKLIFYEDYGAEEYYVIDPDRGRLEAYRPGPEGGLVAVPDAELDGYVSPRLGVRFTVRPELAVSYPDGRPFLTFLELGALQEQTARRAEAAEQQVAAAQQRADAAEQRADALAARLRALGLDPDAP